MAARTYPVAALQHALFDTKYCGRCRVVACNLIMEYTLSSAAVARGFSAYLATLIGLSPTIFIVHAGKAEMDFFALGLVVALSVVLAYGTKQSSRFNIVVTGINLVIIVFVVCAGMPYAVGDNFIPFAPFGARGVFSAASVVFFSFIGFDTVATAAEEVCHQTLSDQDLFRGRASILRHSYPGLSCGCSAAGEEPVHGPADWHCWVAACVWLPVCAHVW